MSRRRVRFNDHGLDGQVDLATSFEADLLGTRHSVEYRSRLKKRLTFKVVSILDDAATRYVAVPHGDAIANSKHTWTHVGQTKTGSRAFVRATALVNGGPAGPAGSVAITFECSADAPFSVPHVIVVDAPVA